MWGFLVIMAALFAVGGLIYLYAKHIGRGDVKAAFEDPHDRKRIFIIGAVIAGFAALVIIVLMATGTLTF